MNYNERYKLTKQRNKKRKIRKFKQRFKQWSIIIFTVINVIVWLLCGCISNDFDNTGLIIHYSIWFITTVNIAIVSCMER